MTTVDLVNIKKQYPELIIYKGIIDGKNDDSCINLNIDDTNILKVNLNGFQNKEWLSKFRVNDLLSFSKKLSVKITFYPIGNISINRLDSCEEPYKQCFIIRENLNNLDYFICVALEEIQNSIFIAQLVGIIVNADI